MVMDPAIRGERCRVVSAVGPFTLRLEAREPHEEAETENDGRAEILIVADGSTAQFRETGTQLCKPLSVSYRPPGYPNRERTGAAGLLGIRIAVEASFADWVTREYFSAEPGPYHYPPGTLGDAPARVLAECSRGETSPMLIDGLIRQLVGSAARLSGGSSIPCQAALPPWLLAGVELMHQCFRTTIKIEDVARSVGVDPAHFSRVFRRFHGLSAKRFLLRLRLSEGASALLTTARPIADIALGLGFSDQAHFTREFTRWTGKSPSRYRREHRVAAERV